MALIEVNTHPGRRELLVFGLLLLLFAALVGGMAWWRFDAPRVARGVWLGGAALAALYFAVPPLRRPIYLGWLYAAFPIGFVVSHVVLAGIYYLVFAPLGWILRATGYDPMKRAFDSRQPSYWVEHDPHRDAKRYFRQF